MLQQMMVTFVHSYSHTMVADVAGLLGFHEQPECGLTFWSWALSLDFLSNTRLDCQEHMNVQAPSKIHHCDS